MNYKDKEQKNLRKSLKEFIFYTVFFMSLTVYNVVTEILQVISILTGSYALFSLEERFSYLDKIEKSFNEKNEVFYSRLEFIMSLLNVANGFLLLGVIPVKIVNLYAVTKIELGLSFLIANLLGVGALGVSAFLVLSQASYAFKDYSKSDAFRLLAHRLPYRLQTFFFRQIFSDEVNNFLDYSKKGVVDPDSINVGNHLFELYSFCNFDLTYTKKLFSNSYPETILELFGEYTSTSQKLFIATLFRKSICFDTNSSYNKFFGIFALNYFFQAADHRQRIKAYWVEFEELVDWPEFAEMRLSDAERNHFRKNFIKNTEQLSEMISLIKKRKDYITLSCLIKNDLLKLNSFKICKNLIFKGYPSNLQTEVQVKKTYDIQNFDPIELIERALFGRDSAVYTVREHVTLTNESVRRDSVEISPSTQSLTSVQSSLILDMTDVNIVFSAQEILPALIASWHGIKNDSIKQQTLSYLIGAFFISSTMSGAFLATNGRVERLVDYFNLIQRSETFSWFKNFSVTLNVVNRSNFFNSSDSEVTVYCRYRSDIVCMGTSHLASQNLSRDSLNLFLKVLERHYTGADMPASVSNDDMDFSIRSIGHEFDSDRAAYEALSCIEPWISLYNLVLSCPISLSKDRSVITFQDIKDRGTRLLEFYRKISMPSPDCVIAELTDRLKEFLAAVRDAAPSITSQFSDAIILLESYQNDRSQKNLMLLQQAINSICENQFSSSNKSQSRCLLLSQNPSLNADVDGYLRYSSRLMALR